MTTKRTALMTALEVMAKLETVRPLPESWTVRSMEGAKPDLVLAYAGRLAENDRYWMALPRWVRLPGGVIGKAVLRADLKAALEGSQA